MNHNFGHTALPDKQHQILRRAIRLEWITIAFLAITVTLVYLVLGNSQAMKAAWIEDLLSFIPPLVFLVAVRIARRRPDAKHPYGLHRSVDIGHLVAGVALTTMGLYLVIDNTTSLIGAEHPAIGSVTLFGHTFWLGWLMVAVMAATAAPPVFIGRAKMKLAKELHDKVLYADADMNKADWQTAVGSIVGITGIGFGLWWADAAAALFIAVSILYDGVRNIRTAVADLMDTRPTTVDGKEPHPILDEVDDYLRSLPWVGSAASRAREEGHVFHIESFIVPKRLKRVTVDQLDAAREACIAKDWKVQDIVLIPVAELPEVVREGSRRD